MSDNMSARVLEAIVKIGKPVNVEELEHLTGIPKKTTQGLMSALEKSGRIKRLKTKRGRGLDYEATKKCKQIGGPRESERNTGQLGDEVNVVVEVVAELSLKAKESIKYREALTKMQIILNEALGET